MKEQGEGSKPPQLHHFILREHQTISDQSSLPKELSTPYCTTLIRSTAFRYSRTQTNRFTRSAPSYLLVVPIGCSTIRLPSRPLPAGRPPAYLLVHCHPGVLFGLRISNKTMRGRNSRQIIGFLCEFQLRGRHFRVFGMLFRTGGHD